MICRQSPWSQVLCWVVLSFLRKGPSLSEALHCGVVSSPCFLLWHETGFSSCTIQLSWHIHGLVDMPRAGMLWKSCKLDVFERLLEAKFANAPVVRNPAPIGSLTSAAGLTLISRLILLSVRSPLNGCVACISGDGCKCWPRLSRCHAGCTAGGSQSADCYL